MAIVNKSQQAYEAADEEAEDECFKAWSAVDNGTRASWGGKDGRNSSHNPIFFLTDARGCVTAWNCGRFKFQVLSLPACAYPFKVR